MQYTLEETGTNTGNPDRPNREAVRRFKEVRRRVGKGVSVSRACRDVKFNRSRYYRWIEDGVPGDAKPLRSPLPGDTTGGLPHEGTSGASRGRSAETQP